MQQIRWCTLMWFIFDQIFSICFQSLEKQIQTRTCESFLALQSFLWQLWLWNKSSVTLAALGSIKTRRRYQCAQKHFHPIFTCERILKRKLLHLKNRNRHCLKSLITWINQNLLNLNSLFWVKVCTLVHGNKAISIRTAIRLSSKIFKVSLLCKKAKLKN